MNPDELPDFPLASWELPRDSTEPLVAPAMMRWHGTLFGREADWLVRVVALNTPLEGVFVQQEHDAEQGNWWFGREMLRAGRIKENGQLTLASDRLREMVFLLTFQSLYPSRVVYLQDEDEDGNWQVRARDDRCTIISPAQANVVCHIQWQLPFESASSKAIFSDIVRAWNDETSDLNFARRWILLSEDEKYVLLVSWKRGGKAEFLDAMKLALKVFAPQINDGWSLSYIWRLWLC